MFRRPPALLLLAAALLFLLGSFVPPVLIGQMKPLRSDVTETFRSVVEGADPAGAREVTREVTVHTRPATRRGHVEVETTDVLQSADGTELSRETTTVLLDRRSRFPVREKGAPEQPEGLRFFFPFPTERSSHPVSDRVLGRSLLIDYTTQGEHNGLEAFEFHHRDTALFLPDQEGIWYSVERTLWVEPRTGTLLDSRETTHVYRAADRLQAEERAFDDSPEFTLRHMSERWDQRTLAQQHDVAATLVFRLRLLQVGAVLSKSLALLAALTAVGLLLRERGRGRGQGLSS